MPKVIDLLVDPSAKNRRALIKELLYKAYFGDESSYRLLSRVDYLAEIARNYFMLRALYGTDRVWGEVFDVIGTLPEHERLVVLAEAYRTDRTVYDELLDALLAFKKKLIKEGAPPTLVNGVNAILSELGKPEDAYRDVKHLYTLYETWKEMGDEFSEEFATVSPTSVARGPVTQTELAKVLNYILSVLRSGSPVRRKDIIRMVGNAQLAINVLKELTRRKFIRWDYNLRSYMITPEGLDYIDAHDVDVADLEDALRKGGRK